MDEYNLLCNEPFWIAWNAFDSASNLASTANKLLIRKKKKSAILTIDVAFIYT